MKNKIIMKIAILLTLSALITGGCSSLAGSRFVQETALNMISPAMPDMIDGLMRIQSGEAAKEGIAGMCLLVSALTELTPENYEFLCTAALAYTAYGMLKEQENPKLAVQLLRIAKDYGMRALMLDDDFREAYEEGGINAAKKVISKMDKDYVKALMWTALPWGLSIKLTMSTETMAMLNFHVVEEMAMTAYKMDNEYFFGLPEVFLMFRAALLPPMMGGTPEKVEKHYKKAMEISKGGLLLTNVFYVQEYLVPYEKFDMAIQKLNDVMDTPHSKYPHMALLNEIAKMRAKNLLDNKEELFRGF